MEIIKQLELLGFHINWTLLSIGYYGDTWIPVLLTIQDICEYALLVLEKMDSGYELVAQLATSENDTYEFNEIFNRLRKSENVDKSLQIRKWRVFLVNQELENPPSDYTSGLFALTDLWVSLGIPDNCPHIIQGRNNTYSPHDYYTQTMYDVLIRRNIDWIKSEISLINLIEKSNLS